MEYAYFDNNNDNRFNGSSITYYTEPFALIHVPTELLPYTQGFAIHCQQNLPKLWAPVLLSQQNNMLHEPHILQ